MSRVGKNIKKIRNVKRLSQQAFADLFNLTRGNISSYEEFRAEPKLEVIIKIANYFSIPLTEFIEKELSVNELLHYNTALVLEAEKLKMTPQLVKVPLVPAMYMDDYVLKKHDEEFIQSLPDIVVPNNSNFNLLAIEMDNRQTLPAGFNFHPGDILIYEQVLKENAHRIMDKLGMIIDKEGFRFGIYKDNNGIITLALNDWVSYPFDIESEVQYWVLKALYTQM
jgi:transcriptional regulator with XRE-family HTH domain